MCSSDLADSESENSQHLLNAARNGDAKAALAILQHSHGWVAKQAISVEVDQRISIIDALRAAEGRTIDGIAETIHDALPHPAAAKVMPINTTVPAHAEANL